MSEPLILRAFANELELKLTAEAEKLKDNALGTSLLIAKVDTPADNELGHEAMLAIVTVLDLLETARKEATNPLLKAQRSINRQVEKFCEELEAERDRLTKLLGDYHQLEQAKRNAAINSTNANLTELEREREQKLSECKTHEELDTVREEFDNKAADLNQAVPPPIRAKGQRVRHNWNIEVVDAKLLARVHPDCVYISPKLREIAELLNEGVFVAGIKAEKVLKVGVVKPKEKKALDI